MAFIKWSKNNPALFLIIIMLSYCLIIIFGAYATSRKLRVNIEVRSALVSDSGPLTSFMVAYPSSFGQTASPIIYLAYIRITNLQDIPITISEFKLDASKESTGPWEELIPITLKGPKLYFLGTKTPDLPPPPKMLTFGYGTFRLATIIKRENLKNATLLEVNPILESEMANPIEAHHLVSGWAAFDSRSHRGLTPGPIYFRVNLRDTANKGGSYILSLPRPTGPSIDVDVGAVFVTGILNDISGFYVKYYSDPFTPP